MTSLPLYALIGLVEWSISVARTVACARGWIIVAPCLVMVEQLLGFLVLQYSLEAKSLPIYLSYCLGAGLGTWVMLWLGRKKRE